jgi:hypothetical protein
MNFTLGVQHELPWGILGEAAYVGNLGRRLLRQPDINQPSFEALRVNAAAPSSQRVSVNALRPYKGYSEIRMYLSDTNSNYNALQIYATRRKGDLTMTMSYTFSKSLSDASSNSDNLEDPFNRSFNYGPTSFDRRHIFITTWTWRLPFFPKARGLPYRFLGGWEVSGVARWQTGQYFTPFGNTSIGTRRADYVGGKIELPGGERGIAQWFNTEAFKPAPDDRRGTAGVGMIEGPGRYSWDLAARKKLAVTEKINLQLRRTSSMPSIRSNSAAAGEAGWKSMSRVTTAAHSRRSRRAGTFNSVSGSRSERQSSELADADHIPIGDVTRNRKTLAV